MVDERQINDSKLKEDVYQQESDKLGIDITHNEAEAEYKRNKEPSRNIFTAMKEAFEKRQGDNAVVKQQKQFVKKQYDDKIQEARRERLLQEQQKKMEDKLAYERLTREEKANRAKQKIGEFTDKVSAGLGKMATSGPVMRASSTVEREYGPGSSRETAGQLGLPSGDRIAMMIGGGIRTNNGSGNGRSSLPASRITEYLGSNKQTHAMRQPTTYLQNSVGTRDYASIFGMNKTPQPNNIRGSKPTGKKWSKKPRSESQEDRIKRMIG